MALVILNRPDAVDINPRLASLPAERTLKPQDDFVRVGVARRPPYRAALRPARSLRVCVFRHVAGGHPPRSVPCSLRRQSRAHRPCRSRPPRPRVSRCRRPGIRRLNGAALGSFRRWSACLNFRHFDLKLPARRLDRNGIGSPEGVPIAAITAPDMVKASGTRGSVQAAGNCACNGIRLASRHGLCPPSPVRQLPP